MADGGKPRIADDFASIARRLREISRSPAEDRKVGGEYGGSEPHPPCAPFTPSRSHPFDAGCGCNVCWSARRSAGIPRAAAPPPSGPAPGSRSGLQGRRHVKSRRDDYDPDPDL